MTKSSAEKSSSTHSKTQTSIQPSHEKTASDNFFAPATNAAPTLQKKLAVNKPGDKFEQEADRMADKVMRWPVPGKDEKLQQQSGQTLPRKGEEKIRGPAFPETQVQNKDDKQQKESAPENRLQRKSDHDAPTITSDVQSAIQSQTTGGQPMSADVRRSMETRFNADFSRVRVHHDAESARLSNQLSARAFTYQNHIFFSRNQYQPDSSDGQQLLAHELTHTIQQGHAIQRSPQISNTTTPAVQRLGIQDALDYFADKAANIPGYTMLTFLLGFNPINMRSVSRTAANLLRALIELIPGGHVITQVLDNHGVINKAAAWLEQKISILGDIGGDIISGLKRFINSLGWTDIFDLGGVWARAKRIFTDPIDRLIDFGVSVAVEILKMVKDVILKPLAALAQGTRGYDLLKAILGEDPITGESVARSAENLLGGFMKLIGQEEIWENIKKGKAIDRAWAWFQGALEGLMGLVRSVPGKIVRTLTSLTFVDIITVAGAFTKIVGAFANIALDFIKWGLGTIWNLLEIIFDVVRPGIMHYIKKTGAALKSIIKNPLPFVGNLVRAAKLGFNNFYDHFSVHLKAGLIDWLTGSLQGVYIPKALSLPELGKFAVSMLGISWAQIRGKLVKAFGSNGETIMKSLETGFDIVVALVTGGPAAAWDLIKEKLTDLKDQVIKGIISFVVDTVISIAVPKLISMFIPGAGFISAIMSIYDTVMVFVNKITKIIEVVVAFIDSIVTIASGNISSAAKRVENILGRLLSLAIAFLAGFLKLGKVTDKIVGVIEKVRKTVDSAIDTAIGWVVDKAKALYGKMLGAAKDWWKSRKPFKTKGGESHEIYYTGDEKNAVPMVASKNPKPIERKLDEFRALASSPDATKEQKGALPIISKTQSALKQSPEDSSIVSSMKSLFEIFDDEVPSKKVEYKPKGQILPGDPTKTQVGESMSIDWLSSDFIEEHPGSKPGSGQDELMSKLVVNPKQRSAYKYIRGHLLNENLGGVGENVNLFPITADANKKHLISTEKDVKNWVITNNKKKKQYALYEVKIIVRGVRLKNDQIEKNYVNSTMHTRVVLKDQAGEEKKSFLASIDSEYTQKQEFSKFDLTDSTASSKK